MRQSFCGQLDGVRGDIAFPRLKASALCGLSDGEGLREDEVFHLSHDARQELLLLIMLASCICTDLRASPHTYLFFTDASNYAAGVCSSFMGKDAVYLDKFPQGETQEPFDVTVPSTLSEGILYDVCDS